MCLIWPHCCKSWLNLLQGVELQGDDGQILVLHVTTVSFETMGLDAQDYANKQNDTVWLIHFLDLSDERLAQSQRTELIEFLSHDLRSPQVAILSLLALQKKCDHPTFRRRTASKNRGTCSAYIGLGA